MNYRDNLQLIYKQNWYDLICWCMLVCYWPKLFTIQFYINLDLSFTWDQWITDPDVHSCDHRCFGCTGNGWNSVVQVIFFSGLCESSQDDLTSKRCKRLREGDKNGGRRQSCFADGGWGHCGTSSSSCSMPTGNLRSLINCWDRNLTVELLWPSLLICAITIYVKKETTGL